MTIDEMREGIAIAMNTRCAEQWFSILDNTDPGHYGAEIPEFAIDITDIWVNVQERTFTFKQGTLSFGCRLGSSREEDGVDMDFSLPVSGEGEFRFSDARTVEVVRFSINESLDLFGDHIRSRAAR